MRSFLFSVLSLLLISQTFLSQNIDKDKLDSYFNTLEKNNKIMGSIAVLHNGEIIYTKSFGYSDVENQVKANANSIYRIGSISKTFTSVLVMKAVEEGKINPEETIDKYFPSIINADKITIRDLLYHRSGIHNFTDNPDYITWNQSAKSEEELLNMIEKGGSDFEPDSKMQYSNSNYVLLTIILERVFEQSYPELLTHYITEPLKLKNTYYGSEIDPKKNECYSYRFLEKWEKAEETDPSVPLGAGAIVSTPIDLVKFSEALFTGKLVNKENLEQMKTLKDNFGLGLFAIPFYNKVGFGHTGGIDGFSSVFANYAEEGISYAFTLNGANFNTNDISITVLSAVFNKEYSIPEFSTSKFSSEDLDKYLGVYSSSQIPLKITITKKGSVLIAQGSGQPSFVLERLKKIFSNMIRLDLLWNLILQITA